MQYFSLILFFFFITTTSSPFAAALDDDTLSIGQSLKENQTLISSRKTFQLGFFTPSGDNSGNHYVGIWYYNVSDFTVVWVANRETPVKDSSSSFYIGRDGNLVLTDGDGKLIWSTNITSSNSTKAQLSESGNLALYSSNGTVVWQSFDHPTDTFLPGMKLSLDRKSGKQSFFTSWKSPNDPSTGSFSLGLDPDGSAQIFIWEGTKPWWRSGQWDRQTFIGTMMRSLYLYGFQLTNDVQGGEMYFTFETFNNSLLRFVLQSDGVENTSMLVGNPQTWEPVWVQPVNACETYAKCGVNGLCSTSAEPICECMQGFQPNSGEAWSSGNWSNGCVRKTELACEINGSNAGGDGFYKLEGVKLPDKSEWVTPVKDAGGCESYCMKNCTCKAYAFVTNIGCLTWASDLIDVYQFPEQGNGNDLYVKLAASELGNSNHLWIVIVIPLLGALVILIIFILLWKKCGGRLKECWKRPNRENLSRLLLFSRDALPDFSGPSEIEIPDDDLPGKDSDLPLLSFETLVVATDNFSESNKLGHGGFGHVYKGKLPSGEEVAVKRLSTNSGQGTQEFKTEVTVIAKLQHRNLVRTLGFCVEGDEKMLVYEYMPNKSLDVYLFDPSKQVLLDWKARFNIIEGIARGLLYLHRDSRLRIVHRDLKASNILLDANFNPKISDFGMARIFGGNQDQGNTIRVVGTYGYMSPEYAMEGLFSDKSDVYSFGILILEMVTGKKNNSFHHLDDSPNIVGYAWPLWNDGRAPEMVDPSLGESYSSRQVLRCIHIGLLCVQDRARDRPDMSQVLFMLGGETGIIRMPKKPTFTSERDRDPTETVSANDATITILSGR